MTVFGLDRDADIDRLRKDAGKLYINDKSNAPSSASNRHRNAWSGTNHKAGSIQAWHAKPE